MMQIGESHITNPRQLEKFLLLMPLFYTLWQQKKLSLEEIRELEFGFTLSRNKKILRWLDQQRARHLEHSRQTKTTPGKENQSNIIPFPELLKDIEGAGNDLKMRELGNRYLDHLLQKRGTESQYQELLLILKSPLKEIKKSYPRTCSLLRGKYSEITRAFWEKIPPKDRNKGSLFRALIDVEIVAQTQTITKI